MNPSTPTKSDVEKDSDVGTFYVRNVSPIYESSNGKYFDFSLISKSDCRRAVCFDISKKRNVEKFQEQSSPVKVDNFSVSARNNSILLNKNSKLFETEKPADDFTPPQIFNCDEVISIKTLSTLASEQLVTVSGKVMCESGVKKIDIKGNVVDKREYVIADKSGSIRAVLWGNDFANTVELNKSYIFKNFRYKSTSFGTFINTPKGLQCSITETAPFNEKDISEIDGSIVSDVKGRLEILMVENISKNLVCFKCYNKIQDGFCNNCKGFMKAKKCATHLQMKIMFETEDKKKITLLFQNHMAQTLLRKLGVDNIKEKSVDELAQKILEIDSIEAHYNFNLKSITEIENINTETSSD